MADFRETMVREEQARIARNRVGGIPVNPKSVDTAPEMVEKETALAAIRAEQEDAKRAVLIEGLNLRERLYLAGEYNAVVEGRKTPQAATEALLAAGNKEGAYSLLESLEGTEHEYDAAALVEAMSWHEANAHLSLEQSKAAAAQEDERRAREAEAARFVVIQEHQTPEIAARMSEIDSDLAIAGVDAGALQIAGQATVDVVAQRNADQKARIAGATVSISGKEGTYTPNLQRERSRLLYGDPNLSHEERSEFAPEGDHSPRARVVKSNPEVQDNIQRLRIAGAGSSIDTRELDLARAGAAARAKEARATRDWDSREGRPFIPEHLLGK